VIYGARAADVLGTHIHIGDVNGDGTSDSVYSGPEYDGDAQERPRCGFVSTTLGRTAFPLESDFADGDDDWRILGDSDWGLKLGGLTDIDADGISEIVVTNDSTSTRPNTAWFVSPLDIDNDGFQQLADNCPLVSNPDQLDADSDLMGDACQLDYDGDGANDLDDCAPSNRSLGRPLAALRVLAVPQGTAAFSRPAMDQPCAPDRQHEFDSVTLGQKLSRTPTLTLRPGSGRKNEAFENSEYNSLVRFSTLRSSR
jgi:hypothetical protein